MSWLDDFIIQNYNIVQFFGGFCIFFFALTAVSVVAAILSGHRRKMLPSQKGKTEFSRFYSNPDNLVKGNTRSETRSNTGLTRQTQKHAAPILPQEYENTDFISNTVPQTSAVVDFYFEFNDQYYLPEE